MLTLDPVAAFAMTNDQAAQGQVFGQLADWQRNPDTIRQLLTHALAGTPIAPAWIATAKGSRGPQNTRSRCGSTA